MKRKNTIEIDCRGRISETVAFLVDGKHFLSGETGGKIRRWQVEDGREVGTPMEVSNIVVDISVSRDGKWVVSGTLGDGVTVWNVETHEKLPFRLQADHVGMVFATDVSPDGTKIATGSGDLTACVWSLSTGARLLDPLQHDSIVVGVKFSPDGRFIATTTGDGSNSVRIYDTQDGTLIVDFPITTSDSASNQSLAWTSDSKQLFGLSHDGNIHRLDLSTGTTLSEWPIHTRCPRAPASIALASNGTFIAAAADTKVSFWDTTTNERIGSVIDHMDPVTSMAMSINYDLVTTTGLTVSLSRLGDMLPSSYLDGMNRDRGGQVSAMKVDQVILEEVQITKPSYVQDEGSSVHQLLDMASLTPGPSDGKPTDLEREISRVKAENARLEETVKSLLSDFRDLREKAMATLEITVRNLRAELVESKRSADQAVEALRQSSDARIARLEAILQERFPQPADPLP